jgi:hypothetical protein
MLPGECLIKISTYGAAMALLDGVRTGWRLGAEEESLYQRVQEYGAERILNNPALTDRFFEWQKAKLGMPWAEWLGYQSYQLTQPFDAAQRIRINDIVIAVQSRHNDELEKAIAEARAECAQSRALGAAQEERR